MKSIERIVAVVLLSCVVCLTGCSTMYIKMTPKAPTADLAEKKIPVRIGLLMDGEFQNYHWKGMSKAEMSKLDYDLGSASKGLFLESFMLVSDAVTLVDATPPYSDADKKNIAIVVKPNIASFREKHHPMLRIANYHAEITYHVTVYDSRGKVLLDKDYVGHGDVKGVRTISPASNYAAPAEEAMGAVVVAIVKDIRELNLGSK